MKKAKLMLLGIAVIGVVGGALAFKAKTTHTFFITDPAGSDHFCTLPVDVFYTTTPNGNDPITNSPYYTSAVEQTVCPATTVYQDL